MKKILIIFLVSFVCFSAYSQDKNKQEREATSRVTAPKAGNTLLSQLDFLIKEKNLETGDTDFVITSEHISSTSGIKHIYYSQAVDGIPV